MFHSVTGYTAVIETRNRFGTGTEQAYAVLIEFGGDGSSMKIDTGDAATFTAWVALLSTGNAEFDPHANQLRVSV